MSIQDAIRKVVTGTDLSVPEAADAFTEIMTGAATDAQIAALIVALRMKGECADEITGAASAMRDKATLVSCHRGGMVVDTCGTGGDGANTFNVSTASALVAAGAGATIAKHGNRSVSSKCGSADVLEALGVSVAIGPETMERCLDTIGIAFLFAPALHKAMKYAIGPRKEIGIRTIFNVLGPLTNPAHAPGQVLGVFSAGLTETMATVLKNMGTQRAFVVHGMDGLDEITTTAATKISEVADGQVKTYIVQPEDFGLQRAEPAALKGGAPAENAEIIRSILAGHKGSCRDIVLLNAAFALTAAGIAPNPSEGIGIAAKSIDSGAASNKLDELVKATRS